MDKDEAKRTDIENRIISKARDIQIREGPRNRILVDLDRLDEFLEECQSLVKYFREHADTTIGVEVVRVYADFTRYFRKLISSSNDDKGVRDEAQIRLAEFETWMDDIISEAAKNWRNLNPDS